MREDSDLAVGHDEAANQVVLHIAFDRVPDWFFDQAAPRLTAVLARRDPLLELILASERSQHGGPDVLGEGFRERIEPLHGFEVGLTAGQFQERPAALRFRDIAQE